MNQVLVLLTASITISYSCQLHTWNSFYGPHLAALILARGGSKGIPLKNLARYGNKSLLKNTLGVVLEVNFTSVWVSTDNELILSEASGVNVHWRSEESATDIASSILGVLDFLKSHPEIDAVALVQCTSPFLKKEYLQEAVSRLKNKECVFSATRTHKLRWSPQPDGTVRPLNFEIKTRPRRQDWPGEFIENGMFYFANRKLIKRGFLQSHRRNMGATSNTFIERRVCGQIPMLERIMEGTIERHLAERNRATKLLH